MKKALFYAGRLFLCAVNILILLTALMLVGSGLLTDFGLIEKPVDLSTAFSLGLIPLPFILGSAFIIAMWQAFRESQTKEKQEEVKQ